MNSSVHQIVDALEEILGNDHEWKYIRKTGGQWAEWRNEYEPIEEDLAAVRRKISRDGPTKELIEERVRIKKAKYERLTNWAMEFKSVKSVFDSWAQYAA